MKPIYLFNPDNDMALAYGKPSFVVRHSIKKMTEDLSFLPAWYADKGSWVLVDAVDRIDLFRKYCPFHLDINFTDQLISDFDIVRPWGWNPSLCYDLQMNGLPTGSFPNEEQMGKIRDLSSRLTAVKILKQLQGADYLLGDAVVLTCETDIEKFILSHDKVVLKAPWSGSGRGIHFVSPDTWNAPIKSWVSRVLLTQGVIVAEPYNPRSIDFAMEFYSDTEGVMFAGYSLFETDDNGVYKRNILASDDEIEKRLGEYVPLHVLLYIRNRLKQLLFEEIRGVYQGYLGVDMLISEGKLRPCVEINLRMNMGILSRVLFDKYICPTSHGYFYIEYYPHPDEALKAQRQMMSDYPLAMESGRIRKGYLPLTPVNKDTSFAVYIIVTH
ncbi:MAG: hypothetical protein ACTTJK_02165 [Phocaeicola sp.]|uniref:hypothetical protein n=1 Tax=Phocaeicola sp. TaxID=2773926 RepID=UPI003FA047BB